VFAVSLADAALLAVVGLLGALLLAVQGNLLLGGLMFVVAAIGVVHTVDREAPHLRKIAFVIIAAVVYFFIRPRQAG
jgi:hypothetical protein